MTDTKTDFNASDYLASQLSDIQARRKKTKKILDQPGEIGVFETKPYTAKNTNAAFEMKGKGAADVQLTGPRPKRPDKIIQEEKQKF